MKLIVDLEPMLTMRPYEGEVRRESGFAVLRHVRLECQLD
jgi:hypothetical protein